MMWWATALCVIVLPGLVSLLLVRRFGPASGIVVLIVMLLFLIDGLQDARNPGSIPIAPEIFGGETIGYAGRMGLREIAWLVFVLVPATLWAAIALLIGWASFRYAQREEESL